MKWILLPALWSFSAFAIGNDMAAYQRMVADRASDTSTMQKVGFALEYFDTLDRVGSEPVSFSGCLNSLSGSGHSSVDPCAPVNQRLSARAGSGTGGVD